MKIFLDNVNINSNSGPNSFGKKLKSEFENLGHNVILDIFGKQEKPDVQLSFIATQFKVAPLVQRLDGIYFNSEQDFNSLNSPIESTYQYADAIIFQSDFNRNLTFHYFGVKDNSFIIRNGTNLDLIGKISPLKNDNIDKFKNVWCCASSWRPHKRLSDNIRYFQENADDEDCLVIAGNNPDHTVSDPRIFYAGDLEWENLISLYKRSKYFIHLAWLDHCPNVVIDARAAGCHIICSSAGGTKEIAGPNSTIIEEDDWDFSPTKLYKPPQMNFSNSYRPDNKESEIDIRETAKRYLDVFESVL